LIEENEEVFEVGGKRGTTVEEADYHDNIESKFYYIWFRKLCINIKEKYGEAIIVIDNAPYHTKSDAPKSNAKKQELLKYLLDLDTEGSLSVVGSKFDKTKANDYLRAELWTMVMEYKRGSTDHYLIDRLAKEYDQTVIRLSTRLSANVLVLCLYDNIRFEFIHRLPPHQCNFNPVNELLLF